MEPSRGSAANPLNGSRRFNWLHRLKPLTDRSPAVPGFEIWDRRGMPSLELDLSRCNETGCLASWWALLPRLPCCLGVIVPKLFPSSSKRLGGPASASVREHLDGIIGHCRYSSLSTFEFHLLLVRDSPSLPVDRTHSTGTRCFSSSCQLTTTLMGGASGDVCSFSIRKRLSRGDTAYTHDPTVLSA